jgi:hypothetical protein
MRSRRGLIASIGAATSLILAGTMALAAVSTVIAFNGWPGVKGSVYEATPTLLAAAGDAGSSHNSSRAAVVVPAAPATRRHKPSVHGTHAGSTSARVVAAPAHTAATAHVVAAAPQPQAVKPQSTQAGKKDTTASVPKTSDLAKGVSNVGGGLGKTVENTGEVLGGVVAPLSPQLGQVVTNATNAVGGIVRQATDLLGRVLDVVAPKR